MQVAEQRHLAEQHLKALSRSLVQQQAERDRVLTDTRTAIKQKSVCKGVYCTYFI